MLHWFQKNLTNTQCHSTSLVFTEVWFSSHGDSGRSKGECLTVVSHVKLLQKGRDKAMQLHPLQASFLARKGVGMCTLECV